MNKKRSTAVLLLVASLALFAGQSQNPPSQFVAKNPPNHDKEFAVLADAALAAMKQKASALNVGGVAVVAYAQGDTIQGWSSKMTVVGRMKDAASAGNAGSNLLGIAYAKAAEMADTLQNSGTASRKPMTGEFGWEGGVIAKVRTGYAIVAFSGGKSEDDVQVSSAGLAVLKGSL
jgi:hypothetical protein